jgi:hypothetical protein
MSRINRLVSSIQEMDAKRQDLRLKLLAEEGSPLERGGWEATLLHMNLEVERTAQRINAALTSSASRGSSPGRVSIKAVADPELQAFLQQVQLTADRLASGSGTGGVPGTSADGLREMNKLEQLKQETQQRKQECEKEIKNTDKARDDLKRDRERLGQEGDKVNKQRQRLEEEQAKAKAEKTQVQGRFDKLRESVSRLKRDKEQALSAARKEVDPRRRPKLEEKVQQLTQEIKQAEHRQAWEERSLQRYDKILESLKGELEEFGKAVVFLGKESGRLEDEQDKLGERRDQIDEVKTSEERRLRQIDQAQQSLTRAMG